MAVYIVQVGKHGPVKIGFARDIISRLAKMQTDNPKPLVLLRAFTGDKSVESKLHLRFADHYIRGDWFVFRKDMLGDLGLTDIPVATVREKPSYSLDTFAGIIRALGGPVRLARELGIDRPAPATLHWGRRGIPARYWHRVSALLAARGIKVSDAELAQMDAP